MITNNLNEFRKNARLQSRAKLRLFTAIVISLLSLGVSAYDESLPTPQKQTKLSLNDEKLAKLREFLKTSGASSVVLMRNGKVAFEFGDIHKKHTIHSIRKPMLNALYGIYVNRGIIKLETTLGALNVDDVVPLTPTEKQATIGDLLKARSGVYLPSAATSTGMMTNIPPRGSYKPNEKYVYNNWDFNVAGHIFEKLTGENIYTAFFREIAVMLQPLLIIASVKINRIFPCLPWMAFINMSRKNRNIQRIIFGCRPMTWRYLGNSTKTMGFGIISKF